MRPFYRSVFLIVSVFFLTACNQSDNQTADPEWPEITRVNKPWTRWWWHGSSVTKSDLTLELETYQKAGLGGMEITPTFGARGQEDTYINYLSPEWTEMLVYTLAEAKRLDLGVDMATGTGWNSGGPTVTEHDAPRHIVYKKYVLKEGETLDEPVFCIQQPFARFVLNQVYRVGGSYTLSGEVSRPMDDDPPITNLVKAPSVSEIKEPIGDNDNLQELAIDQINFEKNLPLVTLMAYSDNSEPLELTGLVNSEGSLDWTAPAGEWKLYALFQGWTGKMVERAGPGGEGFMINHFSKKALTNYLVNFDTAFAKHDISWLRSYFNDSYEVDDAKYYCDWVPGFLEEFKTRRGYNLTKYLPALFGDDKKEKVARVISDYRETINDMILENFTIEWGNWAHKQEKIIRNQAHGSPGNILDLYGASDIPETEGKDILRMKFASSAANVTGKILASSESATFLNENFTCTLLDLKRNIDRFFLAGINHIFYHGTAFTPADEPWPGWFFYVAIHLTPRNPIWEDLPAFNHYVARVQSFLQSGQPDNNILLYYPIYDRYANPDAGMVRNVDGDGPSQRMIDRFNVDNRRWEESNVKGVLEELQDKGYSCDLISDRQLQDVSVSGSELSVGGNSYRVVVVPECTYIPVETFENLISLAKSGATIIFHNELPKSVPGMNNLEKRISELDRLKEKIKFTEGNKSNVSAKIGKGEILKGATLEDMLSGPGVLKETMVDQGLQFTRRHDDEGTFYFILNNSGAAIDGWVQVASTGQSATIFNPMNDQMGMAAIRKNRNQTEVYLQLDTDGSCIVKLYNGIPLSAPEYNYHRSIGKQVKLNGPWKVTFLKGGPTLPKSVETENTGSWTEFETEGVTAFSGTASYATTFSNPLIEEGTGIWLDLGDVNESARIILNGKEMGVLIGPAYRIYIEGNDLAESNTLEIQVTNVAANRIAEVDRSGVFWKKFYNNNLRALRVQNRGPDGMFTAGHWESTPSGLIGPVTTTPAEIFKPE